MIATDPGTITMIQGVGFTFREPGLFQKVHHPEHPIKSIRMDNAAEFSSHAFNDYCMAQGIELQHSVPYVHTQWIGRSFNQED